MSVRNKYIKVGDKLRYLGGDVVDFSGRLIEGEEYIVKKIDRDGDYIIEVPCDSYAGSWCVSKDGYNSECFKLIDGDDKDEEERLDTDEAIDLVIKLSKEVADLRKRLENVEDNGRKHGEHIEMLMDDVVMLDERTQDDTDGKLVRKEVYIYDEK